MGGRRGVPGWSQNEAFVLQSTSTATSAVAVLDVVDDVAGSIQDPVYPARRATALRQRAAPSAECIAWMVGIAAGQLLAPVKQWLFVRRV